MRNPAQRNGNPDVECGQHHARGSQYAHRNESKRAKRNRNGQRNPYRNQRSAGRYQNDDHDFKHGPQSGLHCFVHAVRCVQVRRQYAHDLVQHVYPRSYKKRLICHR